MSVSPLSPSDSMMRSPDTTRMSDPVRRSLTLNDKIHLKQLGTATKMDPPFGGSRQFRALLALEFPLPGQASQYCLFFKTPTQFTAYQSTLDTGHCQGREQ